MSLRLDSLRNFRSLAGMPAADGRRIRAHRLLRSGRLSEVSDDDWRQLARIGLRTVCDLRSDNERRRRPNRIPIHVGADQLWLELRNDLQGNPRYARTLAEDPTPAGAERLMLRIYADFADAFAPQLPALFRAIDRRDDALLIHCAAGKDRTGFVVALLLHALGVAPGRIEADYLRSAPREPYPHLAEMREAFATMFGLDVDADTLAPILDARPAYLRAAFAAIERRYDSVEGYLRRHAGIDAAALERLRDRWLAPET
ncbi:MAG: tyrosine-protein phosphatase [Nevskiales bacterium]|nr:tyrosine-protein phosphatase [Nevskiales bacterium]